MVWYKMSNQFNMYTCIKSLQCVLQLVLPLLYAYLYKCIYGQTVVCPSDFSYMHLYIGSSICMYSVCSPCHASVSIHEPLFVQWWWICGHPSTICWFSNSSRHLNFEVSFAVHVGIVLTFGHLHVEPSLLLWSICEKHFIVISYFWMLKYVSLALLHTV